MKTNISFTTRTWKHKSWFPVQDKAPDLSYEGSRTDGGVSGGAAYGGRKAITAIIVIVIVVISIISVITMKLIVVIIVTARARPAASSRSLPCSRRTSRRRSARAARTRGGLTNLRASYLRPNDVAIAFLCLPWSQTNK